jgi:hypothetical protein
VARKEESSEIPSLTLCQHTHLRISPPPVSSPAPFDPSDGSHASPVPFGRPGSSASRVRSSSLRDITRASPVSSTSRPVRHEHSPVHPNLQAYSYSPHPPSSSTAPLSYGSSSVTNMRTGSPIPRGFPPSRVALDGSHTGRPRTSSLRAMHDSLHSGRPVAATGWFARLCRRPLHITLLRVFVFLMLVHFLVFSIVFFAHSPDTLAAHRFSMDDAERWAKPFAFRWLHLHPDGIALNATAFTMRGRLGFVFQAQPGQQPAALGHPASPITHQGQNEAHQHSPSPKSPHGHNKEKHDDIVRSTVSQQDVDLYWRLAPSSPSASSNTKGSLPCHWRTASSSLCRHTFGPLPNETQIVQMRCGVCGLHTGQPASLCLLVRAQLKRASNLLQHPPCDSVAAQSTNTKGGFSAGEHSSELETGLNAHARRDPRFAPQKEELINGVPVRSDAGLDVKERLQAEADVASEDTRRDESLSLPRLCTGGKNKDTHAAVAFSTIGSDASTNVAWTESACARRRAPREATARFYAHVLQYHLVSE